MKNSSDKHKIKSMFVGFFSKFPHLTSADNLYTQLFNLIYSSGFIKINM